MNFLDIIIYTGTFVFAVTGALKARAHQMDIFGAAVLAFVTAYGGGTIRDLPICIRPLNWVNDYLAPAPVLSAVVIVSMVNKSMIKFKRTIFITDAIGLGMFTVAGIEVSLLHNVNEAYAIVMGVISATFGGLLADILSNTVPDLLKRGELYATACLLGGIIYMLLHKMGVEDNINLAVCVVIIVAIRIVSKLKRLTLPEI